MNIKQGIVIVNEFTTKSETGGTRGGSPGNYVLNYMARGGAIENVAPTHVPDNYSPGYMTRLEAVEQAFDLNDFVNSKSGDVYELDGVAFGDNDISLSYPSLKKKSRDLQKAFDDNKKTVLKTVISFDEEYLRAAHVIPEDFYCQFNGSKV